MDILGVEQGFLAELEKISTAATIPKSRMGRRPISAHRLLEKDKENSLIKHESIVKESDKVAQRFMKAASSVGTPTIAYADAGTDAPAMARKPRKRFELPSAEDVEAVTKQDGRGVLAVIPGTGTTLSDVGATGTAGGERTS